MSHGACKHKTVFIPVEDLAESLEYSESPQSPKHEVEYPIYEERGLKDMLEGSLGP